MVAMFNSKQPLYDQLVDLLKEKIETELEPNTKLESERELSNRYGLSRTTVRLALQELEKMGYIYRRHGREPMYLIYLSLLKILRVLIVSQNRPKH